MKINDITRETVDSAIKVHSALSPGLLESAYKACLVHELLVEDAVIVEVKAILCG